LTTLVATRPLSRRLTAFDPYPIRRTTVETAAKTDVMKSVHAASDEMDGSVTTLDGVRVSTDKGWLLVRASGTQPVIRITAEAHDDSSADRLLEEATELVTTAVKRVE
jgi:Phosphomannomutase